MGYLGTPVYKLFKQANVKMYLFVECMSGSP